MSTLRFLNLVDTGVGGPYRTDRGEANVGIFSFAQDAFVKPLTSPAAVAELSRRDAILRPLSLAIPELRIRLCEDAEGSGLETFYETKPTEFCWHAACGRDWWDEAYF